MSSQSWVCRTPDQLQAITDRLKASWDWKHPISIKWSRGVQKSWGQLALIHIWIRTIKNHMNQLPGNNYDEETVKVYLKMKFGTRVEFIDPATGEIEQVLKSYSRYEKGEMHHHMNQVEEYAACIGCLLTIHGEYEELKRRQVQ